MSAPDAWATAGAYVYILRLLRRLGVDTGNHYQLSFGSIQWVTNMRIAGGVTAGIHNEGGYSYSPSLNDKDDKNDKESEKSPMRVIAEVYGNLVILVMEKLRVEKSPKMQTHYSNSGRNETLSRVKTIVKKSFVRVDTL